MKVAFFKMLLLTPHIKIKKYINHLKFIKQVSAVNRRKDSLFLKMFLKQLNI